MSAYSHTVTGSFCTPHLRAVECVGYSTSRRLPLIAPPPAAPGDRHSWHLYIVRLSADAPIDRDTLLSHLDEARIGYSVHFIPLHKMRYWRERYRLRDSDFPECEKYIETCFSLPLFPSMREEAITRVRNVLEGALMVRK